MQDESTALPARTHPTPLQEIAARLERELDRLKERRPELAPRADRAANLLICHLCCPRQRVLRVRVAGGRPRFLVSGSKGAVYVVDPASWSCTCPDHHRRGGACKHAIACWALSRAARPARKPCPCSGCGRRLPREELVEVGPEAAEMSLGAREGERYCKPCAALEGVVR